MRSTTATATMGLFGMVVLGVLPVWAGSHTWDVHEIFSNASGTIQFIELWEANGTPNETGVGNHNLTSNANAFLIPGNVAAPTTNKRILFATAAFAALPGAPTPNHIIPASFLAIAGDSITYVPWDTTTFGAGQLPTNGLSSFFKGGSTGPATPTNYAGGTFAPPGINDLLVSKIAGFPDGSRLSLSWDPAGCIGAQQYQIAYGMGSQLPAALGGTYNLQPAGAAQCAIAGPPKVWSGIPDPASDSTDFLWFLMLSNNTSPTTLVVKEGSWGKNSAGGERSGPMGGSSGQCGVTTKSAANPCP